MKQPDWRFFVVVCATAFAWSTAAAQPGAAPDPRLDWWRQARFGMFIHWGLYAIPGGEWGQTQTYGEWIRHEARIPLPEYDKFVSQFNPVKFDADTIVRAAKAAGMRYIVITTKHHDGFCLFDSALTDFDVMSTPFHRDIMKEMADACRREGLKIGWYYSIMDWHHPDYLPRRDWETDRPTADADFERYVAYMKGQLRELLTNYGDIGVLWFDGQWEGNWNDERGRDLYDYVRSLQPGIIINSRVGRAGGNYGLDGDSGMLGDYGTPEQFVPETAPRGDWETCMTMNGHWGYCRADKDFKTSLSLVRTLVDVASKGGNLLLNVGPSAGGEIPAESGQRLDDLGRWMGVNEESVRGTRASPLLPLPWGRCTLGAADDTSTTLYLHVFDWPHDTTLILPGMLNDITSAFLIASGDEVACRRDGENVVMDVGTRRGPDPLLSVIRLIIKGPPDAAFPPTIRAASTIFIESLDVSVSSDRRNVEVRCTTDGSDPTAASPIAAGPVSLRSTATVRAACFRDGRPVSPIAESRFELVPPLGSLAPAADASPGLRWQYFEWDDGEMESLDRLNGLTPIAGGVCEGLDLAVRKRDKHWAARFEGDLAVPETGIYRFRLGSDDGSRLFIDDTLVVDNDKPHSFLEKDGDIALAAGRHSFRLDFFENWGGFDLKLRWAHVGTPLTPIPPSAFSRTELSR